MSNINSVMKEFKAFILKGNIIAQMYNCFLRNYYILSKRSAPVGSTQNFLIFTNIVFPNTTLRTIATAILRLCGNSVTDFYARYIGSHLNNDTCKFMSGNQRRNSPRMFSMISMYF